jgi:hypothetical protein
MVIVSDLFNAKAALTPGAAGATTMVLTGTLASAFGLPPSITALVISFLMGLCWIVMTEEAMPWAQKIVLYALNSLTIFSVAFGLNSAGVQAFAVQPRGFEIDPGFFRVWQLFS